MICECGILERLVYKNKNQHCRCSYFQHLMKGIAQRNARNRKKQKNPYILGTKLLVRKRDELVWFFGYKFFLVLVLFFSLQIYFPKKAII
ncbi:hypothetical protein MtrunA17_Chr1g0169631 [Medicago truncatula]|uniref:Transmembrane protein n=1 Tax=Medicago truncatula TaxID=3880 RepID=A0A396JVP4_MEDTR|nr:hypothetical protein MtrunA17_Chr1g0169631 [Medicago truncatula]